MTLKEKRAEWEKNQTPFLIVPQIEDGYPTVYVVSTLGPIPRSQFIPRYQLNRYFPVSIGTPNCSWEVSVDKQGSLVECLMVLREKLEPYSAKFEQVDWTDLNENPLVGLIPKKLI